MLIVFSAVEIFDIHMAFERLKTDDNHCVNVSVLYKYVLSNIKKIGVYSSKNIKM